MEGLVNVIGMLYIVEISMYRLSTGEQVKQKLLVMGCEKDDIERKLRWIIDSSKHSGFKITDIKKIREKVHVLSTTVKQPPAAALEYINRDGGSTAVPAAKTIVAEYKPNLYAIGISTTILAKDEDHAIRKLANILASRDEGKKSTLAAELSQDSIIQIEEVPLSSGYATARDVSSEINNAHFVRG